MNDYMLLHPLVLPVAVLLALGLGAVLALASARRVAKEQQTAITRLVLERAKYLRRNQELWARVNRLEKPYSQQKVPS